MSRPDLARFFIAAGVILLAVQVVGYLSNGGAALLALGVGGLLWHMFAADYRDRH
jgi:hypothetical protein